MDKKKIFIIIAIVLVVVVSLIILLPKKGDEKETKKDNTTKKPTTEKIYEIENKDYNGLTISDIEVETRENESVLRFVINNNTNSNYPEGTITFDIMDGDKVLGTASSFVTEIESNDIMSVEIIVNKSYENVTDIKVVENN